MLDRHPGRLLSLPLKLALYLKPIDYDSTRLQSCCPLDPPEPPSVGYTMMSVGLDAAFQLSRGEP